ncbi:hypothetical protein JW756_00150 [Candidatus Woesearchaeota archaeon]|nr:hypothetical protein [Candidatus Woesearchaeota archaeon]
MGKQLMMVYDSKNLDDFINQLNQLPESYFHHDFPLSSYMSIQSEIRSMKDPQYLRNTFSFEGDVTIKQSRGLYQFVAGHQFQHFSKPKTWMRENDHIMGEEILDDFVIKTEITLYKRE